MSRLLEVLGGRDRARPAAWIEGLSYARRLLLGDAGIPWLRSAELVAFFRDAQALLRSDVVGVPLEPLCDAWLDAHPDRLREMAGGTRPVFALRRLLADEELRRVVADRLRVLRFLHASVPLVISMPAPHRWVASVHGRTNGPLAVEPSEDDADAAAVRAADWLRSFAGCSLDGIVVEEDPETPSSAASPEVCRPLFHVAAHYRWAVGMLAQAPPAEPPEGVDFWISGSTAAPGIRGVILSPSFWCGAEPSLLADAHFYYVRIPEAVLPERVLERLESLRS